MGVLGLRCPRLDMGYNSMNTITRALARLNSGLSHFSPATIWLFGVCDALITAAIVATAIWAV